LKINQPNELKKFSLFYIALLFCSCVSVNEFNARIEKEIPVNKLKEDVDYAQAKLKRFQPKIDLYLSEDELNFKFDSLKQTLNVPLKANEFYLKLFPIFESLKHGHTGVYPIYKRYNSATRKKYKNSKSAFNDYSFFWKNDTILLVKDFSKNQPVPSGARLTEIDGLSTQELYNKYNETAYGDGYNTTYRTNVFNRTFLQFISLEQGLKDSVELTFVNDNQIIKKKTYRIFPDNQKKKETQPANVQTKTVKVAQRQIKLKQRRYGYNKSSKTYSKDLFFPTNDSTIAVLKITDFRKGKIKKLYREVFTEIHNHKVKNLILDLRNNGGGYIKDAHCLYSYLVDDSKSFLGKKIVANKWSFGKSMYHLMPMPTYPFLWIGMGTSYVATSKISDKEYELKLSFSSAKSEKELVYQGNLYVLINGGSYSASSLIASNLQLKNRAFFVGEETGGDFNGTAAGLMPKFTLPNSKLSMSVGTVFISPIEQRAEIGHGVFPDKEIVPTLKSKMNRQDAELSWVITDIKNRNIEYKKVINKENHLPK